MKHQIERQCSKKFINIIILSIYIREVIKDIKESVNKIEEALHRRCLFFYMFFLFAETVQAEIFGYM